MNRIPIIACETAFVRLPQSLTPVLLLHQLERCSLKASVAVFSIQPDMNSSFKRFSADVVPDFFSATHLICLSSRVGAIKCIPFLNNVNVSSDSASAFDKLVTMMNILNSEAQAFKEAQVKSSSLKIENVSGSKTGCLALTSLSALTCCFNCVINFLNSERSGLNTDEINSFSASSALVSSRE